MSGCGEEGRGKARRREGGSGTGGSEMGGEGDELDKDENIGPSGRETKG